MSSSAPPPPVPPSVPPVPPASPPSQSFDEIIRQRQAEAAQARLSGQFQQGQVRSPSLRTTPIRPPSTQMSTRPLSTPAYIPPPNYYGSSSAVGGQGCDQSCNQGNCQDGGCDMDMKAELMDCDHMDMNEGGHDDAIAIQRTPMRIMAAITMAVAVVELGIGELIVFIYISNPPSYALIISRTTSSLSLLNLN